MEHEAIRRWFAAGLAAVAPATAIAKHLTRVPDGIAVDGVPVAVTGRLIVAGIGKAAVEMARGAEAICGDLVTTGFVITKDGHIEGPPLERIHATEAAHPIPDARGEHATRQLLDLVGQTQPGDIVLALISGGGSALLSAPRPPLTLTDLAITTDLLLRAGAPIDALNAVRTPLSLVKGGGLRRAAPQARFVTLILSDVLGNDPAVIASGPTIPVDASSATALSILADFDVAEHVPAGVVSLLEAGAALTPPLRGDPLPILGEGLKSPSPSIGRGGLGGEGMLPDLIAIVGDNVAAVEAAAVAVRGDGYQPRIIWENREGEARELGREWVDCCAGADPAADVLLGGGEATVTVTGDGIGGRNTEFALAAALALAERNLPGWTVASLATDGEDGPTGVAGAIADTGTAARAVAAGVDPAIALVANDSLHVFEAAGGLVVTGPTGTNVNDLYFAVRA